MPRRPFTPLALLLAAVVTLGGCGSAVPDLSDPAEIVSKSVEALQSAKTVHLEATIEGTFTGDLMGTGQTGDMSLAGTTLSADLDIEGENAHVSAAVPALLGLTADIIVVGSETYTRISLAGPKYQKSATTSTDATDPASVIAQIKEFLVKPEVSPSKKDDAACGSKTCYQVEIALSAADLATLMPDQDIGDGSVVLTILVEKDSLYPAGATVHVTGSKIGDVTLKLTMSDWDKAVMIEAPPADQVE